MKKNFKDTTISILTAEQMKIKTTKFIEGTLRFVGMWDNPIILETEEGDVDIAPIIYKFFEKNNRKPARDINTRNYFSVKLMENVGYVIDYIRELKDGKLDQFVFLLKKPFGFGMTNIQLYLESVLTSLSGRHTVLELRDDQITIKVGVPHPHYPIRTEQKIVLLHELAHWLLPVGEHHSPAFWDKAWSLFRRYRCPIKVALAREGNYLKGAVAAYHRSISPKKE